MSKKRKTPAFKLKDEPSFKQVMETVRKKRIKHSKLKGKKNDNSGRNS